MSGYLCKVWLGKHPGTFCFDAITSRGMCKIHFQIPIVSSLFKKVAFFLTSTGIFQESYI